MIADKWTRPAFYALPAGGWRDYVTLLHPPYTLWLLAYVVLGAAAAPTLAPARLAGTLIAFFLAVGISAHAFDELKGRPLGTRIPSRVLWVLGVGSLAGSLGLGIAGSFVISPWLGLFVAFGLFIVPAYSLELAAGRFHSGLWFVASWGAFPFLTSYWVSAGRLGVGAVVVAIACATISLAQHRLSARVRAIRRRAIEVQGAVTYRDGTVEPVTPATLLAAPEAALRWLSVSVVLLAVGWLALRW